MADDLKPLFPRDGALEREIQTTIGLEAEARDSILDDKLWLVVDKGAFRKFLDYQRRANVWMREVEGWIEAIPIEMPERES